MNLGGAGVAIGGSAGGEEATDDRGVRVDAIERRLGWIAERSARVAPRYPSCTCTCSTSGAARRASRPPRATARSYGISPAAVVESPWFLTGPEEEMARKLVAINERYGISYFTVGEEHADTLHTVMRYI